MILVDTSVWIMVLKDGTGNMVGIFREMIGTNVIAFTRFTQLELLQGAKNEREWDQLDRYLKTQYNLETTNATFREAGRIYFELRRKGISIGSPLECCIAQIAIENGIPLLHRDSDFDKISRIRPLSAHGFAG